MIKISLFITTLFINSVFCAAYDSDYIAQVLSGIPTYLKSIEKIVPKEKIPVGTIHSDTKQLLLQICNENNYDRAKELSNRLSPEYCACFHNFIDVKKMLETSKYNKAQIDTFVDNYKNCIAEFKYDGGIDLLKKINYLICLHHGIRSPVRPL